MDELIALLSDLVAINSVNPDLMPGAPGETEIARFIASWLEKAGLEVDLVGKPDRPNVVALARGTGGGRTLLLNGHMDTVGIEGMPAALQPQIRNGRLYGRGAYDMKGGLAACMLAIRDAARARLRGDVIFTAVIDEEYASLGTEDLAGRFHADGAIVAEFTELQVVVAHRGFAWFDIETTGRAAHGSRPDLGIDAITRMGRVLVELDGLDQHLRSQPAHPLLGNASLHASLIRGGKEIATYPDRCQLSLERRTLPSETPGAVEGELQAILSRLAAADSNFHASLRPGLVRSPMETPVDAGVVRSIKSAAASVLKRPAQVTGVPFWTDAALLAAAGIPSLLFGPSGAGAHADEEWVDLSSVETCAQVYLATALDFCA